MEFFESDLIIIFARKIILKRKLNVIVDIKTHALFVWGILQTENNSKQIYG